MVPARHGRSVGLCVPGGHLRTGADPALRVGTTSVSTSASANCCGSASSAWLSHLAPSFECEAATGLVLVATMPPKRCQLLPYQTPSEGRLAWSLSFAFCSAFDGTASQHSPGKIPRKFPGNRLCVSKYL